MSSSTNRQWIDRKGPGGSRKRVLSNNNTINHIQHASRPSEGFQQHLHTTAAPPSDAPTVHIRMLTATSLTHPHPQVSQVTTVSSLVHTPSRWAVRLRLGGCIHSAEDALVGLLSVIGRVNFRGTRAALNWGFQTWTHTDGVLMSWMCHRCHKAPTFNSPFSRASELRHLSDVHQASAGGSSYS